MSSRCGRLVLLAVFVFLGLSDSAHAQIPNWGRHGITWEVFQDWINREAKAQGYRLAYLNGYDVGGSVRYAAVAVKDGKESQYQVSGSLDILRKKDAEHRAKGFRPICVTGYLKGRSPEFGIVWIKGGRPAREKIAFHLTEKGYTERINLEKKHRFLPSVVTGYADGSGSYRFTVLFVPAALPWDEAHDLTEVQYQKAIDDKKTRGFRPSSITAYPTPSGLRFATVFVKIKAQLWYPRHNLSSADYQAEFVRRQKDGFVPISITGYLDRTPAGPEVFDQAMRKFTAERGISAGTIAVTQNGNLLLERGYGIDADAPLRLASLSKPFTAAAIYRLIREGKLTLDTKVFPLLGLRPPPKQPQDRRLNDITIRHLLGHKGGWDRDKTFDPMFRSLEIAAALKASVPPGPVDIIRYMMGQPLQFDPGAKYCYSNFGYCVLGRVIEKISGKTYSDYVRTNICEPLGARSVALGRTLPKYRNPREPVYRSPGKGRNVLDPESKEQVPASDGTFYLEAMDAHGGLIASARDVVRFLDAYWMSGEPRQGAFRSDTFFGSLPGTFTMAMQRPNGVNVVVLFNQSADSARGDFNALKELMQDAADRQSGGLLRYAALWVKSE